VAGGCSLASILWIKDHHPELFEKACVFGHSNTYMARWLTGRFAIDPSSASLTALYNTNENNLDGMKTLPELSASRGQASRVIPSHGSTGRVTPKIALELGLAREPEVVIGGNDAVLAAYSVGVRIRVR